MNFPNLDGQIIAFDTETKLCKKCGKVKSKDEFGRRGKSLKCWCIECWKLCYDEKARVQAREKHRARKHKALMAYGTICQRCSINDPDVLTIDHINNDGSNHRKELGISRRDGSSKIYRWLEKQNYPVGFMVLCFNCNVKKHLENLRELSESK